MPGQWWRKHKTHRPSGVPSTGELKETADLESREQPAQSKGETGNFQQNEQHQTTQSGADQKNAEEDAHDHKDKLVKEEPKSPVNAGGPENLLPWKTIQLKNYAH